MAFNFGLDLGSLIGGIGSLFGPSPQELIKMQEDSQRSLMLSQFLLNQDSIRAQNQYNSPLAQVNRLKQAGLNTNLALSGNSVVGTQPSAGSTGLGSGADVVGAHQYGAQKLQMFLGALRQTAEIENIKADTGVKKSAEEVNKSQVELNTSQIALNKFASKLNDATYDDQVNMQKQLANQVTNVANLTYQQFVAAMDYNENQFGETALRNILNGEPKNFAQMNQMLQYLMQTNQISNVDLQNQQIQQDLSMFATKLSNLRAQTFQLLKSGELAKSQANATDINADNQDMQTKGSRELLRNFEEVNKMIDDRVPADKHPFINKFVHGLNNMMWFSAQKYMSIDPTDVVKAVM